MRSARDGLVRKGAGRFRCRCVPAINQNHKRGHCQNHKMVESQKGTLYLFCKVECPLIRPHANQARGKRSTTKLTNRRENAQIKSVIQSTRWSRAVSVLTTKISRFAGLTCLVNQQPTQTRLHFFVNTSVAILRLCDFSARPRRVCADTRDRIEQDLTWQSRSAFDTLGRG